MDISNALNIIRYSLGFEIEEVLRLGLSEEEYDEGLIREIAQACRDWEERQDKDSSRWMVSYYNYQNNNGSWELIEENISMTEAYRLWYELTGGGKNNSSPKDESYYYFGRTNEILNGRHLDEDIEDDFSYQYLLEKTFG